MTDRSLRFGLLGLGSLAYACLMFVWFSLAAYLPQVVADLGLSSTQAGILTGAVPLTYVPVSLFSGFITDRIGPYRAIGAGLLCFGAAHVARAGAGSFWPMLGFTVLVGVGATTITFGLPKLVSDLFPADDAGLPSSIYLLGSFAGTAGAFSLGRGVLGPLLGGWRPLFRLTGLTVLAFAVVWWLAVRLAPLARLQVADARVAQDSDSESGSLRRDVVRVFRSRSMRLLVVVGVVYLLVVHGLQNWLATVLGARGVSPTLAATITSGFVVMEAVGTLAVPWLSDRLGERGDVIAACAVLCALGTATLLVPNVPFVVPVAGTIAIGVGVGGLSPLVRMVPPELEEIGPALTGTAVGLIFAVGELGGFFGPFLLGSLHDVTGSYVPGLAVICLGCVAAVFAGRALPT